MHLPEKEIRFLLEVTDWDKAVKASVSNNTRIDSYYKEYRIRKLTNNDGSIVYYKIASADNGNTVKDKITLTKKEYDNYVKDDPIVYFQVDAIHPIHNITGERLFIEKITVIPTGQVYYSSEYEYNYDGVDSIPLKKWIKLMNSCQYVKTIKNLGEVSMLDLYFIVTNKNKGKDKMDNILNTENLNIAQYNTVKIDEIPNLAERANMLATEDMGVYINEVASFFSNQLTKISSIFKSDNETLIDLENINKNTHLKAIVNSLKYIKDIEKNVNYSTVSKINFPVMVGLKTDYYTATGILTGLTEDIVKILPMALTEWNKTTSKVLSDPNYRRATKPLQVDSKITRLNKDLSDAIDTIIDGGSTNDRLTIDKLIPNIASLHTIVMNLKDFSPAVADKSIKSYSKSVTDISKRIDTLYDSYKETNNVSFSKVRLAYYSNLIESTAKLVTNYITIAYIFNQISDSMVIIINKLKDYK